MAGARAPYKLDRHLDTIDRCGGCESKLEVDDVKGGRVPNTCTPW